MHCSIPSLIVSVAHPFGIIFASHLFSTNGITLTFFYASSMFTDWQSVNDTKLPAEVHSPSPHKYLFVDMYQVQSMKDASHVTSMEFNWEETTFVVFHLHCHGQMHVERRGNKQHVTHRRTISTPTLRGASRKRPLYPSVINASHYYLAISSPNLSHSVTRCQQLAAMEAKMGHISHESS